MMKRLLFAALLAFAAAPQENMGVLADLEVPTAPTPFLGNGKRHLAYELHITNFTRREMNLTRVEALGDRPDAAPLARYEGNTLTDLLNRPGAPADLKDKRRIGPGLRAILFIWITIEEGPPPATLRHRLTFSGDDAGADGAKEMTLEGATVKVRDETALVLGPPLRGERWLAANGPAAYSIHRRALIAVEGRAHVAQRFAIDWVQLGEPPSTFTGDLKDNANYHAYGAEILAVADGVVTAVKDGIPQNIPGLTSRAVPITLETIGGNHVVLDLGGGRYAFYAHMQPGSLRVKLGDKVRRGQVLGLVGNSGNSTEPHLHFHVTDANSPLGSEGLPYVLEFFEQRDSDGNWHAHGKELPLQNAIVRFPAAKP